VTYQINRIFKTLAINLLWRPDFFEVFNHFLFSHLDEKLLLYTDPVKNSMQNSNRVIDRFHLVMNAVQHMRLSFRWLTIKVENHSFLELEHLK